LGISKKLKRIDSVVFHKRTAGFDFQSDGYTSELIFSDFLRTNGYKIKFAIVLIPGHNNWKCTCTDKCRSLQAFSEEVSMKL
jgi:hypothetical protein